MSRYVAATFRDVKKYWDRKFISPSLQRLTRARTPNISATVLPDHLQIVEQRFSLPMRLDLNALWPAAFRRRATQHAPRTPPAPAPISKHDSFPNNAPILENQLQR